MSVLLIIFAAICLIQLLLIILIKKPKRLLGKHSKKKQSVSWTKWILVSVMIGLYAYFFVLINQYHKPQPLAYVPYEAHEALPSIAPNTVVSLGARQTASITNLYFLYVAQDKSKDTLAKVATTLRSMYCKSLCIVNIYDDQKAFQTDLERVNITSDEVMKDWNRKNYVFVADHYLGYLDAVPDANFTYYPFHDGYYKKAKSGSLDGY